MSEIIGSKVPLVKKEKVVEILATFENVFLHESLYDGTERKRR